MHLLTSLLPDISHLGLWGYWVVGLIAYLEAVAVVGSLVPGASTVVFAGFLSAHGYLDVGDLVWFVAIGAILGDTTSYYLGTKGIRYFRDERRFLKLAHLDRGKRFFERYGSKSIFFGRFLGPVRSIIPFIAGLTAMDRRTFMFWNVIGGITWAVAHLAIGYFAGDALRTVKSVERWGLIVAGVWLGAVFLNSIWRFFHGRRRLIEGKEVK